MPKLFREMSPRQVFECRILERDNPVQDHSLEIVRPYLEAVKKFPACHRILEEPVPDKHEQPVLIEALHKFFVLLEELLDLVPCALRRLRLGQECRPRVFDVLVKAALIELNRK